MGRLHSFDETHRSKPYCAPSEFRRVPFSHPSPPFRTGHFAKAGKSDLKMKRPLKDEWGHDPSVQSMRRVFSMMEKAQYELLRRLNISLTDPRLRMAREQALELFETIWSLAIRKGIFENEQEAASLYLHCFTRGLSPIGIEVPQDLLSKDEKIVRFLKENLP